MLAYRNATDFCLSTLLPTYLIELLVFLLNLKFKFWGGMLQIIMLWVFCYLLLIIYKIICFSCSDFFSFFYFFFSLINLARGLPVVLVCFGFVDLLVLYFTDFCHLYFLYFGRLHSIFSVFFFLYTFFFSFSLLFKDLGI